MLVLDNLNPQAEKHFLFTFIVAHILFSTIFVAPVISFTNQDSITPSWSGLCLSFN